MDQDMATTVRVIAIRNRIPKAGDESGLGDHPADRLWPLAVAVAVFCVLVAVFVGQPSGGS